MDGGAVNGRGRLLLAGAILAAGALGAAALVRFGPAPEPRVREPVRPAVEFVVVRPETVRVEIASEGAVAPRNRTVIQAAVAGRVGWVSDRLLAGAEFGAGEVLARIEPEPHERARLEARSALAQAELRVARAEAERRVAAEEWAGREPPDPLALGIPQLEEARAAAAAARAAVAEAERDLELTGIAAPFDLRVVRRLVEPGQFVAPGTPLAEAYGTAAFEVRLPLAEADLPFLDPDARPRVTVEVAGAVREGRIVRPAPEIDPVTRLVAVIAEIRAPLTPGLFVGARIEGREIAGVVRLPRAALRGAGQVLVVDDRDRLRFRGVSVLRDRGGDEVLVDGGLAAGERVSITPLAVVADGMAVRPVAAVRR